MKDYLKAISVLLCFFTLSKVTLGIKFPTDINRCKYGDTECIITSANKVLEIFAKVGNNNINLLTLDPLYIPRISIQQGEDSPVNVELLFTNNTVIGLRNFKFHKIIGFQKNPEGKYELRFKGPSLELRGPYKINGKILILPIQGVGQSTIKILDPDMLIKFTGKVVNKNGKDYLKPEHTKLSFTLSKIIFNLSNLYNGDKALGDNTNLFLNENWRDVFPEVKVSIFEAFSQIIDNVLQNVFAKVPYNELFAEE